MDATALVTALAQLSRSVTDDFSPEELLRSLCEVAARALPVDGAGVMLYRDDRTIFVHATGEQVTPVEQLQEEKQAGPCLDSMEAKSPTRIADIERDGAWPAYQALSAELGLQAVLAMPLVSRGESWGSLDLYRRDPGPWTDGELQAAQVLADVAVSYLVMAHDRDESRVAQEALVERALHDDLTGLPNRRFMHERLEHALTIAERTSTKVAVVFVDLDLFKAVNDTYGHVVADEVLVEVSRRLRATLRKGDTLARFAGDEFVIVCEGFPDESTSDLTARIEALADRLQEAVQRPIKIGDHTIEVTASMGVSVAGKERTADEVISEADTAMYAAKRDHRNRASFAWGPADNAATTAD
jgi:diguanylate cyclase (GGDEF)-like protein